MIIMETDKTKAIYVRTNRRVKWQYAEYGGRFTTANEAIERAKERFEDHPFEYLIEDMITGENVTGFAQGTGRKGF